MNTSWEKNFSSGASFFPAQGLIRVVRGAYPRKARLDLKGKKILDVGCGDGRNSEFLRSEGALVSGVETTEELTELARTRFPQVSFHVGNNKELPFENGEFDAVVSWNSCYYMKKQSDLFSEHMAEMRRVLTHRESMIIFSIPQPSNFIYRESKPVMSLPNYEIVEIGQDPFGIRNGQLMARFSSFAKLRKELEVSGINIWSYGVETGDWFGLQYDWWILLCSPAE